MKMTDVDTRQKQEIVFAISGPVICGPDGFIDTEHMNLPSNDLIGIIEWTLSQDLGPNKMPVAVCKSEEVYAVDQKRLRDVMKKYDSRQLRTVSSKELTKMKREKQQKMKREMQTKPVDDKLLDFLLGETSFHQIFEDGFNAIFHGQKTYNPNSKYEVAILDRSDDPKRPSVLFFLIETNGQGPCPYIKLHHHLERPSHIPKEQYLTYAPELLLELEAAKAVADKKLQKLLPSARSIERLH
jgi:hypothetical protein